MYLDSDRAGPYALTVAVEDLNGPTPDQPLVSAPAINYTINSQLSAVSLAVNPASPGTTNSQVTLTAAASGGNQVVYQFVATLGSSSIPLNNYGPATTCQWTPQQGPGNYSLSVYAKDLDPEAASTTPFQGPVVPYRIYAPLTNLSLAVSPGATVTVDTPMQFTASTIGGANVLYAFQVNGSVIQPYSSSATCNWKPTATGTFSVVAMAYDQCGGNAGNPLTTLSYPVTVVAGLSSVTLAATPPSPSAINTNVTLTATAVGGASDQYTFEVLAPSATTWTTITPANGLNTTIWTPTQAGTYKLQVLVGDASSPNPNATVSSQIQYVVSSSAQPFTVSLSANPAGSTKANTAVKLTASVTWCCQREISLPRWVSGHFPPLGVEGSATLQYQ